MVDGDISEFLKEDQGKETIDVPRFIRAFERTMTEISPAMWPTRPNKVRDTNQEIAKEWAARAKRIKNLARREGIELLANLMLGLQCVAEFFASQFKMWNELKNGNADGAWSALIDAQDYLKIAGKVHDFPEYGFHAQRLEMAEKLLFPRPVFQSCGFVYRPGECTICKSRFDLCDHEEGNVYAGVLCREVNRRDLKLDHISIVPEPRDKRCRVVALDDDHGIFHDYFTGEEVTHEPAAGETVESQGRRITGYAYVFETIRDV